MPPLTFQSLGDAVRLSWDFERLDHHRLEFISRGQADIELAAFQRAVVSFVEATLARLQASEIGATLLSEEWSAITEADEDEKEYCRAAAALGRDPYDLADEDRDQIVKLGERVPSAIRHEFFAAADLAELESDAAQLNHALLQVSGNATDLANVRALHENGFRSQLTGVPWDQGYAVARQLREHLGVGHRQLPTLEALAEALQVDAGGLERSVYDASSPRPFFEAVVATNEVGSPGFVVGRREASSRLFHLCRGFFEFLTSTNGTPALATRTGSDRQRRNRAFAAEFLAPSAALKEMVPSSSLAMEDVDELAAHFGVSPYVVVHQLENHGIGSLPQGC